jgi:DNA-binding XRE family transcriptional regulator
MGLPRQNINRLETGTVNPKAHTLFEMARLMKVPIGELMEL